ncbi:MAG: (d)CMP kinase, partial [Hyphomonadaceae bacterium]|nr:(d)CMP kinase [Clostridia bacterium]
MIQIALDGPSGAGKSTIAKKIANQLGLVYIDTGAMYRAVGLFVLKKGIQTKDIEGVGAVLDQITIDIHHDPSGQQIVLNGENVTDSIRTPEVSIAASDVSAIPSVRIKLVELQRDLAKHHSVIMDGRDIGTYVLPDAKLKIFLTAAVENRAERRYDELMLKKVDTTYDDVLKDIKYRDDNDSSRAYAPLKQADDAILIDTTGNSFEQSYEIILKLIADQVIHVCDEDC